MMRCWVIDIVVYTIDDIGGWAVLDGGGYDHLAHARIEIGGKGGVRFECACAVDHNINAVQRQVCQRFGTNEWQTRAIYSDAVAVKAELRIPAAMHRVK